MEKPLEQLLNECTKDQLVKIAYCYGLDVDRRVKETVEETVKVNLKVH